MFIITTKSAHNGIETRYIEPTEDSARLTFYRHLNERGRYEWVTLVDVIDHWEQTKGHAN